MGIFGTNRYDLLESRVRRLEALVAQLAAGQGVDVGTLDPAALAGLTPQAQAEARRLKHSGRSIHAIKYVREQSGLGLREAKELVDGL